ncbi:MULTISPECIES: hypothetical protein [Modicisalibacter]|uniref:hypothetical protein n=1 Tax=Modicisalibacter TaxID=574347 RepID=UPI00100A8A13|nr:MULTISPECIES: hypothetical protein [Halomonadaceae]MBZ9556971.1 hypothetical protein [Modicisalibacter sp. R2A 31.J]MBZ9574315.1 hypothetical protein [Modicisalibacter sp. MOD 31.J]
MVRRLLFASAGSAWLLSGCFAVNTSQAPMATTYPYSEQRTMQAAHHWDVLAEYEAAGMLRSRALRGKSLFINATGENSTFARSFQDLLTSQLVANGALVRTDPINAAQVNYRVRLVEHTDRDVVRAPQGMWTALASGIAVATMPINHWGEPTLALIPGAALVDLFSGSWERLSNQEIVITTQVTEDGRILYSSSHIYYINGGDAGQYAASKPLPVTDSW